MRNRMLSFVALLTILLLIGSTQSLRAVTVSLSDTSAAPGDTLTISIYVDDASGIACGDITLAYALNILIAVGAHRTSLTSAFLITSNVSTPGEILISMASATGIPSGTGPIVDVDFTVKGDVSAESESPLTLRSVTLYSV